MDLFIDHRKWEGSGVSYIARKPWKKGIQQDDADQTNLPSKNFCIPLTLTLSHQKLCRNSVHGSRASPRTDDEILKINQLAVRPELVEGGTANYDTAPQGRGEG